MKSSVAIVGAGVSGLTTAVLLAERGYEVSIFADETGRKTTSAAAGAIWFPYDAEPVDKVIPWALETYQVLVDLASESRSGVSLIELRQFARDREIEIPNWARSLGADFVATTQSAVGNWPQAGGDSFQSGFSLQVPLTDTTIYIDFLRDRLTNAGGTIHGDVHLERPEEIDPKFGLVINCAGFGAKKLVNDPDLEPHRGQVAIVPKIEGLNGAIVCDDQPLMYAIPRTNDCVFGGTNEVRDDRVIDPAATSRIVAECCHVLNVARPQIVDQRVGLRPFRKSGVRVGRGTLRDGRPVIHNYGHGGAGFTLSWGCAHQAVVLAQQLRRIQFRAHR